MRDIHVEPYLSKYRFTGSSDNTAHDGNDKVGHMKAEHLPQDNIIPPSSISLEIGSIGDKGGNACKP